jgi:penicillin-binding protein 1C
MPRRDTLRHRLAMLRARGPLYLVLLALAALAGLNAAFPPPEAPPYSVQVLDARGHLLTAYLTDDDKWRLRSRLEHVTPDLMHAIVNKEDKYFLYHPGVNVVAVARAMYSNIVQGRRVSGASTITMQVARLLEPAERNYAVKLREMLRALQLELRYSKRDILELYLSLLPMGGNIEGVAGASYIYFDRPPDKLSLAQSIALAVLPNDPNGLRPDRGAAALNEAKQRWIRRFRENNVFTASELDAAYTEYLAPARHAIPSLAPQYCLRLKADARSDILIGTLDAETQGIAERLLRNHVRRVMLDGVGNGAILVLRNDSMHVVAYCASADFHDAANQGQVDGIRAVRSPGSTLKPFLYARAFDQGYLTPSMRLLDIPTDFGGYIPENFDLSYSGEVTARQALLRSLNIPAVRLLAKQGLTDMLSWLSMLGFRSIEAKRESLGLSVILGGCGATLEELVRGMSMFAREGELSSMHLHAGEKRDQGRQLLSPSAAYLLSEILSHSARPDLPLEIINASRLPRIAWKTGTSYGKRDAWAIGWNSRYTIGVWMGNFSGRGAPSLSGAVMATPLLVDLFNAIDYDASGEWLVRPEAVVNRDVCARSGKIPSTFCQGLERDLAIRDVSSRQQCNLMQEYAVDRNRTMHYCPECTPSEGVERDLYAIHDPELMVWFRENRVDVPQPPPHNPACTAQRGGGRPAIISPSSEYEYYIEKGSDQHISLQAAAAAGVQTLYWYVDGELVGSTEVGEKLFFQPRRAEHRVVCMDDAGRRSMTSIRIIYY